MNLSNVQWWPHFAVGLCLCLTGWSLYWAGLHLAGGALGALLGGILAWAVITAGGMEEQYLYYAIPITGILGLVTGIFFMRGVHRVFFFFLGSLLGLVVAWNTRDVALGLAGNWLSEKGIEAHGVLWRIVFVSGASLLGGVLLLAGSKWLIAILTSFTGAALVCLAFPDPLALVGVLPLGLATFLFQMGIFRWFSPRGEKEAA